VLADVTAKAGKFAVIAPLASEAVKRIDAIFDIERAIDGCSIDERLAERRHRVAPLVTALCTTMCPRKPRVMAPGSTSRPVFARCVLLIALTSERWAADYNEIKDLGAKNSVKRSARLRMPNPG
jgi:hypothetical protein